MTGTRIMYQFSGSKVSTLKDYFGYYFMDSQTRMGTLEGLLQQITQPAASFDCLGAAGNTEFRKYIRYMLFDRINR